MQNSEFLATDYSINLSQFLRTANLLQLNIIVVFLQWFEKVYA